MKRSLDEFRCNDVPVLPHIKKSKYTDSHFPDLAPSLAPNLSVLFIGFNPGHALLVTQHHYAHFTNRFWKLFNELKLLNKVSPDAPKKYSPAKPEHDYELIDYGIGFTDLALRCTLRADQLSPEEKLANVPRLLEEIRSLNAKYVVFIGKGIWDTIIKYISQQRGVRIKLLLEGFHWGEQSGEAYEYIASECHPLYVFVFPNTLGLVTTMSHKEKLSLWLDLVGKL